MGKSKNNDKKSAYIFFCEEKRQANPALNKKGIPELVQLCSAEWENLVFSDKDRYVQMAKEFNNGEFSVNTMRDGNFMGRFDSFGNSMLAVQQKKELKAYDTAVMQEDITSSVTRAFSEGTLFQKRFHLVHFNVWVNDDSSVDVKEELMPCEIGLVEFTLEEGISQVFQQMIDPRPLDTGSKGGMRIYSEKYHKIWLDNPELSDGYEEMVSTICSILAVRPGEKPAGKAVKIEAPDSIRHLIQDREMKWSEENCDMLPIYVLPKDFELCRKAMNWLVTRASPKVKPNFRFYELHRLFLELLRVCPDDDIPAILRIPTLNIAEAHLERDVFLYTPGMSCTFHEEVESRLCAAAGSAREAFIICDFVCQVFSLPVKEGRHTPWGIRLRDYGDATSLSLGASFAVAESDTTEGHLEFENLRPSVGDASLNSRELGFGEVFQHSLSDLVEWHRESGGEWSLVALEMLQGAEANSTLTKYSSVMSLPSSSKDGGCSETGNRTDEFFSASEHELEGTRGQSRGSFTNSKH